MIKHFNRQPARRREQKQSRKNRARIRELKRTVDEGIMEMKELPGTENSKAAAI